MLGAVSDVESTSGHGLIGLPDYGDLFAGREIEYAWIVDALTAGSARLLTLTGPPGVGKTRLAVACAREYAARRGAEVAFVDLAPIRDRGLLAAELARSLGVRTPGGEGVDRLSGAIGDREIVILVDNIEHLLPAPTWIGRLLEACPRLRLLVTSRERLRLRAEQELPVTSLPTPEQGGADIEALAANPSMAVLVDRARRTDPAFAVTRGNSSALVDVAVSLEGVPLALELAAARLKVMTPAELARRLDRQLEVLSRSAHDAPPRQRALRAAIAWSYELLGEQERLLFRTLSIFHGSWSLADAEGVCGDGSLDLGLAVESLLEKSLVRRIASESETARFSLLESLRQFGHEQLVGEGEADAVRARHAEYFATLAARLEASPGAHGPAWSSSPASHHVELLAAVAYFRAGRELEQALVLAAALGWQAHGRGDFRGSAAEAVDEVLAAAGVDHSGAQRLSSTATCALLVSGVLAWGSGRLDQAESTLLRTLAATEQTDDARHGNIACIFLGHVTRGAGRYEESAVWTRRAADGFAAAGNELGEVWARHQLALLLRDSGDPKGAVEILRTVLRDVEDQGGAWSVATARFALGTALLADGAVDEAREVLDAALEEHWELEHFEGLAWCLESLAGVAVELAAHETAAQLLGAADSLQVRLGADVSAAGPGARSVVEVTLSRALGPEGFEQAKRVGAGMPLPGAVELAKAVAAGRSGMAPTPVPAGDFPLTRRERQVATLIVAGRTNRQISRALGIAEKTVEVHVHNSMAKLEVSNRAEVAAWAVVNGLVPPLDQP